MSSKTRVFIWGSCVSRDTFEHLDPEQYELVSYVARQSALSATTRSVEQFTAPRLASSFQQRMVSGDFGSNLRPTLAEQAAGTDVLLIDLTDERLGVYLLPDGTVVTRSVELMESGLDQTVAENAQYLPFGTQQHFEYWSGAIGALGDAIRQTMPGVTIALLDIPWAAQSESGQKTPDSFGVTAAQANPVFRPYVERTVQALGAHLVSLRDQEVTSGPTHPWGEAPFHYAEDVYLEAVRRLTGVEGRAIWRASSESATSAPVQEDAAAQPAPTQPGPGPTGAETVSPHRIVNSTIDAIDLPRITGWVEVEDPSDVVIAIRDSTGDLLAETTRLERRPDFTTRHVYKFELLAPDTVSYGDVASDAITFWSIGRENSSEILLWEPIAAAMRLHAISPEIRDALLISAQFRSYRSGDRNAFLRSLDRIDTELAKAFRATEAP